MFIGSLNFHTFGRSNLEGWSCTDKSASGHQVAEGQGDEGSHTIQRSPHISSRLAGISPFGGPLVLSRIVLVDRRGGPICGHWCPLVGPTSTRGPGELLRAWWSSRPSLRKALSCLPYTVKLSG